VTLVRVLPNHCLRNLGFSSGRLDYVEEDGPSSITEDFFNNIEYFIFERKKLQNTAPKVDAWIQKMFGDKLKVGKESK
jgi:hypothetical protein